MSEPKRRPCVRLTRAPRPVPGPQAQTSGPQPFMLCHADATRHRPNDLPRLRDARQAQAVTSAGFAAQLVRALSAAPVAGAASARPLGWGRWPSLNALLTLAGLPCQGRTSRTPRRRVFLGGWAGSCARPSVDHTCEGVSGEEGGGVGRRRVSPPAGWAQSWCGWDRLARHFSPGLPPRCAS